MTTADEVREKYLKFFEKKKHVVIPPAPLVLENDPTTLFTSSGMQPLVPFLMGKKHPSGKRLTDSQPSIRLGDIDEVGDGRHQTYFEMLGNWSLGDYFKKEQLSWIWEFLTEDLNLSPKKMYVSIFEGNNLVPKDNEALKIWKSLGVSEGHIFSYGVEKNWWSRSGTPDQMPKGEIGGPDSEIFFEFEQVKHSKKFGEVCHPNCDCGRFLEIGNSVFMQYKKTTSGLEELPQKNVDFGGGLERLAAAVNNEPDVFKIDIFSDSIQKLEEMSKKKYEDFKTPMQIVADHLRASKALVASGIVPTNKMHGYVLRRLIRRMSIKLRNLNVEINEKNVNSLTDEPVIAEEILKFQKTLEAGLREVKKLEKITGKKAFDLYQSFGFPLELTVELFTDKGQTVDLEEFKKEFEKHKEVSRSVSTGIFKGGLEDHGEETTKLHTATHLLHAALRKILGDTVSQKGSHITHERLRFDFSYPQKLTDDELKKVEDLINSQIEKALPVTFQEISTEEAINSGALHFFAEKYGEKVKVYTVGKSDEFFSKEICGGPHVENTSLLSRVKIIKQEKIGSGIIRIYAKLAQDGF